MIFLVVVHLGIAEVDVEDEDEGHQEEDADTRNEWGQTAGKEGCLTQYQFCVVCHFKNCKRYGFYLMYSFYKLDGPFYLLESD